MNERPFAGVVGKEEATDLALVKVERAARSRLGLGDSEGVEVGDWWSHSAPRSLSRSVTTASIS